MKKVMGVGINDTELAGPTCTKRDEFGRKSNYKDYMLWYGMLVRGFCPKFKRDNPTYINVTVCDEWLIRSNFQKWFFTNKVFNDNSGSTLELDKDLLVQGNTLYGPDTCALVPQYLNVLFNEGTTKNDDLPLWVRYKWCKDKNYKLKNPYTAKISARGGKVYLLGYFSEPQQAHFAAQKKKLEVIQTCLASYREEACYREDIDISIQNRILKLIYDIDNGLITTHL